MELQNIVLEALVTGKAKVNIPFEWEDICPSTSRAKVIGGWLIRTFIMFDNHDFYSPEKSSSVTMVFVPDPFHQWEV